MNFIQIKNKIKMLFIILPTPKDIYCSHEILLKYTQTCNHGLDTFDSARKRIQKGISTGKLVYTYQNDNNHVIYRYYDLNYECMIVDGKLHVINLWKNKYQYPIVKVNKLVKEKWNKKYGLLSHYEQMKGVKDND